MRKLGRPTAVKILIIDDEPDLGRIFIKIFQEEKYHILTALDGPDGILKAQEEKPDVILLDLNLPGMNGIDVLREIRTHDKNVLIIILTGYGTIATAIEAMRLGAFDYLAKPIDIEIIRMVVQNALKTRAVFKEKDRAREPRDGARYDPIIGDSLQMSDIRKLIHKASACDISVILKGESGTGKELIARAIHQSSRRAEKPFVVIDCAALPETLLESEIFGYEKGSFTGAYDRKIGRFELAHEGTVFLDEIGNLNGYVQMKLLRVIQEKSIERLGGKKLIPLDFRLIAGTNINLEAAMEEGKFREDLYYRLNVFCLALPPLRERRGDIELLLDYFLKKYISLYEKSIKGFSPEARWLLTEYSWPGNVRELKNVIESAVVLADDQIVPAILPQKIQVIRGKIPISEGTLKKLSRDAKKDFERRIIKKVLDEVGWNKSKASKVLEVDYKTLLNKIKEYGIFRQ